MEMNQITPEMMMRRKRYHWIKKIVFLVIIVILLVVCFWGQAIWVKMNAKGYQAVFLTNGQVYFGKLSATGGWFKLTDIYYLQSPANSSQPLQQAGSSSDQQTSILLVKLGNELHGPMDAMFIERDKVLFWENLKDDGSSQVVEKIKKAKAGQK